ncbi:MAG: hypothetical protein U1G07_15080 [Verrucomicrobiota bacterium]
MRHLVYLGTAHRLFRCSIGTRPVGAISVVFDPDYPIKGARTFFSGEAKAFQ